MQILLLGHFDLIMTQIILLLFSVARFNSILNASLILVLICLWIASQVDCDSDLGSVAFVCCIFVFAESVSDLAPDARTNIIRLILSLFFLLPQCCPIFLNVAQCFSKLPLRSNKPGKRKLIAPNQSQLTKSKRGVFCIFCIL